MDGDALSTLSVMVVEDELLIAMDPEMQVEAMGHRVVATAVEADEAVRKAEPPRISRRLLTVRGWSHGEDVEEIRA